MTDTTATTEPAAEPVSTVVPVTHASLIAAPAAAEPAAPSRPDGLPDAYWDDATGIKPEAYARLAELEAAQAAAREGVPETADGYKLTLPDTIVGLDGKPLTLDADDPLAKAVLPALHKLGVNQAGVDEIIAAYAMQESAGMKAEAEAAQAYVAAEQAKLGDAHEKRTAAIHSAVTAAIGAGPAEALRVSMRSAEAVIALELLIAKTTGPAISGAPAASPTADLDGLSGAELLTAIRAKQAG